MTETAWERVAGAPLTTGLCRGCGRDRPLGRVRGTRDPLRCVDCCFGPPQEFWVVCSICDLWGPAPCADCDDA